MSYARLTFVVIGGCVAFYAGVRGVPVMWAGFLTGAAGVFLMNIFANVSDGDDA
jgi:hypothetical protein